MMLAGAKAIAARAQPPGKGDNIVSLKNCQIQFVWDGYLLYAFWELWSFATKNAGFEHNSFLIKNVYWRKYIVVTKLEVPSHTRLQKKKIPRTKGGAVRGPQGPPLNPPFREGGKMSAPSTSSLLLQLLSRVIDVKCSCSTFTFNFKRKQTKNGNTR